LPNKSRELPHRSVGRAFNGAIRGPATLDDRISLALDYGYCVSYKTTATLRRYFYLGLCNFKLFKNQVKFFLMNWKRIIVPCFALFVLMLFFGLGVDLSTSSEKSTAKPTVQGGPMSMGAPGSIGSRLHYDWLRLQDPDTEQIPRNARAAEIAFVKNMPQYKADGQWMQRGPGNVGGRTRGAAIDRTNPNVILAGSVTGGVFKSDDKGESFRRVSDLGGVQGVTCITQDPRPGREDFWYYGTGESYGLISTADGARTAGDGLFFSLDAGESWIHMSSTSVGTPTNPSDGVFDVTWKIIVDHTNLAQDVLYVAVRNAIMRSDDGGLSWETVLGNNVPNDSGRYTDIAMTESGVLYAAISSGGSNLGYYRSENGLDWTQIDSPAMLPSSAARTVIAINPCDENEVFFLTHVSNSTFSYNHALWKYNYVSGNGSGEGALWEDRTPNMPRTPCEVYYTFDFGTFNSQSSYDLCMAFKPDECNTLFIGGTNVYRSKSAFAEDDNQWIGGYRCNPENPVDYVYPNHHPDQHIFFFDPENPDLMYTGNDGGLYRSNDITADSISWEKLDGGYITTQFYTVAIEPGEADNNIIVGGTQDNGTRMTVRGDDPEAWTWPYTGDGSYAAIAEGRDNYYLSWQRGRVMKFDIADDGTVLGYTRIDDAEPENFTLFITPFILDATDNDIMYMAEHDGVRVRRNLSDIPLTMEDYVPHPEAWERMDIGQLFEVGRPSCFGMSRSDGDVLYVGTVNRRIWRIENPKSETPTRVDITGDDFQPNSYLSSIAVDEFDSQHLMISFSNYNRESLFRSTDGGATWTNVGGNLEGGIDGEGSGPAVLCCSIHQGADGIVYYAGTSAGLFSTTDIEAENVIWQQESPDGIGHTPVDMIASRAFDDRVVIGTHGAGIFSNGVGDDLPIGIEETGIDGVDLGDIYPNPFREYLKVELEITQTTNLSVELFDLAGKKVANIAQGKMQPGKRRLKWQSTDLPTGSYLLRISNGESQITKQLIHAN